MDGPSPHAALLSGPGVGHLIPVLELGKRLATHHNFEVTVFVIPSIASPAETQIIASYGTLELFKIIKLPFPDISELVNPDSAVVTQLAVIMREARPVFRTALAAMERAPSVLIVDLFGTEFLGIADEMEIPKYVYIASNAWFLALTIYVPILDEEVDGEYVEQKEPLKIPGCRSLRPDEVVDPMLNRRDQQYQEYLRIGKEISTSDGVLINIWEEFQVRELAALRDDKLLGGLTRLPIYPVGPLIRPVEPEGSSNQLLDWLDKQPEKSVLYISFGSGGTLCFEQFMELAWGLELSKHRFFWVVHRPTMTSGDKRYLTAGSGSDDWGEDNSSWKRFLKETKEVGLVVPEWTNQLGILSHPSVGGFVTHCGWNSVSESIINEVPMIAWPLYAEQRMNSILLAEELRVAVRPEEFPAKKVVGREEVEGMVRKIMEGREGSEMRMRLRELKNSAMKALSHGGSSYEALSQVAKECELSMRSKAVGTHVS